MLKIETNAGDTAPIRINNSPSCDGEYDHFLESSNFTVYVYSDEEYTSEVAQVVASKSWNGGLMVVADVAMVAATYYIKVKQLNLDTSTLTIGDGLWTVK